VPDIFDHAPSAPCRTFSTTRRAGHFGAPCRTFSTRTSADWLTRGEWRGRRAGHFRPYRPGHQRTGSPEV